jgi:hypothetical protein
MGDRLNQIETFDWTHDASPFSREAHGLVCSDTSWVGCPHGLNAAADSPESLRGSARAHPAGECAEYSCEPQRMVWRNGLL